MLHGPLWRAEARGGTQGLLERLRRRKIVEGPTVRSALHKKDERAKTRKPYRRFWGVGVARGRLNRSVQLPGARSSELAGSRQRRRAGVTGEQCSRIRGASWAQGSLVRRSIGRRSMRKFSYERIVPSGVCYTVVVARWRRSLIVRTVVVVLLLWTAADITNTSLCALEQEQDGPLAASTSDVATFGARSTLPLPVAPEAPHIDDCFCCSHCVEVADLAPRLLSEPALRDLGSVLLASPRIFGVQLYHPPLA